MNIKLIISGLACTAFWAVILMGTTGCMQVLGASDVDFWGAKMKVNSGFEVKAGIMQYDHALERKGMKVEAQDNLKIQKY